MLMLNCLRRNGTEDAAKEETAPVVRNTQRPRVTMRSGETGEL